MSEKLIGHIIIIIGIFVMMGATYSMFQVFLGKSIPIQVFNFDGLFIDAGSLMPQNKLLETTGGFLTSQKQPSPKIELFPANMINTVLNTIAHVIFMSFIVSLGYKIASIGTMLSRPIVVKIRGKTEVEPTPTPQQI